MKIIFQKGSLIDISANNRNKNSFFDTYKDFIKILRPFIIFFMKMPDASLKTAFIKTESHKIIARALMEIYYGIFLQAITKTRQ
jgi:hypothetical protein